MQQQGTLTDWNDEKGFGFIAPSGGGSRVFVHISSFPRGRRRPAVNDRLSYQVRRDSERRLRAGKAQFLDGPKAGPRRAPGVLIAFGVAALFFALLAGLVHLGLAESWLIVLYALVSGLTLMTYGFDKYRAQNSGWRTPEASLHLFSLAGGWPGALIAQRLFRHKTRKRSFQVLFWGSVVANLAGLGLVLFPEQVQHFLKGLGVG